MSPAPTRADAVRNRARLLEAAEAAFAAHGTGAPTEEIARSAGVGVATLFRHFPTKEALIDAVLANHLQRLAKGVEEAARSDDPGAAFYELFRRIVDQAAKKNALVEALASAGGAPRAMSPRAGTQLRRALRTLLVRAQGEGTVRRDLAVPELLALLVGASRAVERVTSDDARGRIVAVICQGLRPAPSR